MRYVLAIATLVLSGVLLLLGIGQRTFLAGPAEIRYEAEVADGSAYAVIPADVFDSAPGQPNIVVQDPDAFVSIASAGDLEAWVEPFDHEVFGLDREAKSLSGTLVEGVSADEGAEEGAEAEASEEGSETAEEAQTGLDPRGSDLWLDEWSANSDSDTAEEVPGGAANALRVPISVASDQNVLIALDGEQPLPDAVSVAWVQDRSTPWAGPLLVAGGVLAVAGLVLYVLAVDHNRRGLGPRRGRRGPLQGIRNTFGKKKQMSALDGVDAAGAKPEKERGKKGRKGRAGRIALPALGLSLALSLSGCSPSYWPSFGADAEPTPEQTEESAALDAAPVPVTPRQTDKIIQRVSQVADAGDEDLDAEVLEARFTGDALAQRSANYKIREELSSYEVIPPRISDESLDYELVQSTEGWPRTLFATVSSESVEADEEADEGEEQAEGAGAEEATEQQAGSPSLALVMRQESPHDNYKVSRVIALRGGISMPDAAPVEEGTAVLADDLRTLVLPPGEVGQTFASVLQNGPDSDGAELFDLSEDDALMTKGGAAWQAQAQERADDRDESVKYSVSVAQGEEPVVSLSTGVGGALVSTTVIENRVDDSDGGRWKPQAEGAVTALSGLEGDVDRLQRQVAHQMLFYVPGADSGEKIQILGVTTELVGASE